MARASNVRSAIIVVLATAVLTLNGGAHAQFTVTTTNDGGVGSLRNAIEAVNTAGGVQVIDFALDFSVPQTIQLGSTLATDGPALNLSVTGPGADRLVVAGERTNTLGLWGGGFGSIFTIAPTTILSMSGFEVTQGDGGIDNNGALTLSNMSITNNGAGHIQGGGGTGGGIRNTGTLVVKDSSITGNFAATSGGGIHNEGQLTVSNSTLSGNSVATDRDSVGPAGEGGGLYSRGTAIVSDSKITNNSALLSGGGIHSAGDTRVINSTVSGNKASSSGGGLSGSVAVYNSTVVDNLAGRDGGTSGPPLGGSSGGGIDGRGVLVSSIVADNRAEDNVYDYNGDRQIDAVFTAFADDISGTFTTAFSNLIGSPEGHNVLDGTNGNIVGADPLLDALADNGGDTLTYALLTGSPATDAGSNPLALTFDQRGEGFPRVVGSAIDIGAFELKTVPQAIPLPATVWLLLSAFGGLGLLRFKAR